MNVLHSKVIGDYQGFRILFEAVQPTHYPDGITQGEADAIVSNSLVCFTPHISAMRGSYTVGMIQCPVEITADYDLFYNSPEFNELVEQTLIEAQITMEEHGVSN